MSKKKNKNKKYVKALIQNYIELQKYLPMREKYMEHQRQLMEEIKKDLKTVKDLRKQIPLITDPLKRREKTDCGRYLIEICAEKARRVIKQNEIFGLIDIAFGLN